MIISRRLCAICCYLVINVYTAECIKELEGGNEPPKTTDLELFSIQTTRLTLLDFAVKVQAVYRNLDGLAHHNRRLYTRKVSTDRKNSFMNSCGFIQSLMMLICFAACVVTSGVTFFMFTLIEIHLSLIALFLLPPWAVLLFIIAFMDLVYSLLSHHSSIGEFQRVVGTMPNVSVLSAEHMLRKMITDKNIAICTDTRVLITMLLRRSGDVELNPGPGRDGSRESGSPHQQGVEETAAHEQESTQPVEGFPRAGIANGVETAADLSEQGLQMVTERYAELPSLDNGDDSQDRDDDSPLDHQTLLKGTTPLQPTARGATYHMAASTDPVSSTILVPDAATSGYQNLPASKSVLGLTPTASRARDEADLVKEAHADWIQKSDQDKKACCEVFDEVMIKIFLNLARLYKEERDINFCPQCLEIKDSGEMRQSHIIPKCMLETFRLIHVPVQKLNAKHDDVCILANFSKWSRFPPRKAKMQLMCDKCEVFSSINEGALNGVYLTVTNNPDTSPCQIDGVRYRNLHHIFAQILFRGILANVDIDTYYGGHWFEREEFKVKFTALWNYSRDINFQNPPALLLFLLPNKAYNDETTYSLFSMERILRCPHYTELVNDKAGIYLYSKIDCFHIVLPIDKLSEHYFGTFRNGLYTDDGAQVTLLQCTRPKRHVCCKQPRSFSEEELTMHFPDALLQWNVELYSNYIHTMLSQPDKHKIRDYDIPFILFPGEEHKFNDPDLNIRKNKALELAQKAKSTVDLAHATKFDLKDIDNEKAIVKAAKISPLRVVMVSKAEYKQVIELKVKLSKAETDLLRSNEERKILLSKIDCTLAENQKLRDAQVKLHQEVDDRRESEVKERDLRIEVIKNSLRSYEEAYETLSQRYSAASVRYKGGTMCEGLREEITTSIQGTERLMNNAKDLEEVYNDCVMMHEKFKELRYSRTLSY